MLRLSDQEKAAIDSESVAKLTQQPECGPLAKALLADVSLYTAKGSINVGKVAARLNVSAAAVVRMIDMARKIEP